MHVFFQIQVVENYFCCFSATQSTRTCTHATGPREVSRLFFHLWKTPRAFRNFCLSLCMCLSYLSKHKYIRIYIVYMHLYACILRKLRKYVCAHSYLRRERS
ncbi:hypothetical protein TGRUB_434470 [Toxoplasma gondii RUB]|uniref:Uncharacterized protein n=1 Tax=Toxoplasma gondii RUB TaxID=935652 RepID=A0A086LIU2_TOXGO|nr:hypothetical protein TGRUB_434470 [Toxoplasma gondii RUB]